MSRPRRQSVLGGIDVDLGGILGAAGGDEVSPVAPGDVPFTDSSFDARTQVRFKPTHPILNLLSGGEGSALANRLNIQQALTGPEDARVIQRAKQLTDINRESALKQRATESFIKATGVLPEERPDLYKTYVDTYSQELLGASRAGTQEETAKARLGRTQAAQQEDILQSTFPYRQSAGNLLALASRHQAQTAESAASGAREVQPYTNEYNLQRAKMGLEELPTTENIELGKAANLVMPHGRYNILTGEFTPFPTSLLQASPQVQQALLGTTANVGKVVGFDPLLGKQIIQRQQGQTPSNVFGTQSQEQTAPSGVTAKPASSAISPGPSASTGGFKLSDMYNPLAIGKMIGSQTAKGYGMAKSGINDILDVLTYLNNLRKGAAQGQIGNVTLPNKPPPVY